MNRWLSHVWGVALSALLVAGLGYAIQPHMFELFNTNRALEQTQINRVQGIAFHPDTRTIEQPIDASRLHVSRPSFETAPICLRLWLGSKALTQTEGVIRLELAQGAQTWVADTVYRQNNSWMFCFDSLRLNDLRGNTNPVLRINVLQPERHAALSGIHAGFGPRPMLPASVNGQPVEPSIQYIVEVKAPWGPMEAFKFAWVLFFAGAVLYVAVLLPLRK